MESASGTRLRLRAARPDEAARLSALALRSKAVWGYSRAFIEACRAELTFAPGDIARGGFVLAEDDARVVGFYALAQVVDGSAELEALFVEPEVIGRGIGRALIEHAKARAARCGARRLVIQGDPHAARFYAAAGGVEAGTRPSGSIAGRSLPLFVIELAAPPGR
ncbi:MAG: GNAT family N-acetyltransferase [Burkholderiales bacterium]|nr:GNAT family N-acetyltransferase [Burkholderiales bacterium]